MCLVRLSNTRSQHRDIRVIDDAVNLQPLRPHAVTVKPLLQVVRVLVLHLVLVAAAVLQRWGLVHVHTPNVVTVHGGVVHVQLAIIIIRIFTS